MDDRLCPVCYENMSSNTIVYLECIHSLCRTCLRKLTKDVCPLCRKVIRRKFKISYETILNAYHPEKLCDYHRDIRVRVHRRKRRRQMTMEYIDRPNGQIVRVES